MSVQQYNIDDLEIDISLVEDVYKCLLHTIIFHRALGPQSPSEETINELNITYALCDDETIKREVKSKVEAYIDLVKKNKWNRAQMIIGFYEVHPKKGWWGTTTEKICWEQWILSLRITNNGKNGNNNNNMNQNSQNVFQSGGSSGERDRSEEREKLASVNVLGKIMMIGKIMCDQKTHIPRLQKDPIPFPFEINYQSTDTWGAMIWSMLRTPTPL